MTSERAISRYSHNQITAYRYELGRIFILPYNTTLYNFKLPLIRLSIIYCYLLSISRILNPSHPAPFVFAKPGLKLSAVDATGP